MIFTPLALKDSFLVQIETRQDERGFFARTFCQEEFKKKGLVHNFVQCSTSFNIKRGLLRGMHYQATPFPETKLVRCVRGRIFDVILDLRNDSPTFCEYVAVELSEENYTAIYIPAGFAHGFQTLTDHSEVLYHISEFYHAELSRGVRWNDSAFNIKWPITPPVLSDRDANFADFKR